MTKKKRNVVKKKRHAHSRKRGGIEAKAAAQPARPAKTDAQAADAGSHQGLRKVHVLKLKARASRAAQKPLVPDPVTGELIKAIASFDIKAAMSGSVEFERWLEPTYILAMLRPLTELSDEEREKAELCRHHPGFRERDVQATFPISTRFYHMASIMVDRVYDTAVRRTCPPGMLGRCHDALLTLAQVADFFADPCGVFWDRLRDRLPLRLARDLGHITHESFFARVCFVWRCVLRLAAAHARSGLAGLSEDWFVLGGSTGASPLDQMIADAAPRFDLLNEVPSDVEAECGDDAAGPAIDALSKFMKDRHRRWGTSRVSWHDHWKRVKGGLSPVLDFNSVHDVGQPVPPKLIPDEKQQEGARKLAAAVASKRWKKATRRVMFQPPRPLEWHVQKPRRNPHVLALGILEQQRNDATVRDFPSDRILEATESAAHEWGELDDYTSTVAMSCALDEFEYMVDQLEVLAGSSFAVRLCDIYDYAETVLRTHWLREIRGGQGTLYVDDGVQFEPAQDTKSVVARSNEVAPAGASRRDRRAARRTAQKQQEREARRAKQQIEKRSRNGVAAEHGAPPWAGEGSVERESTPPVKREATLPLDMSASDEVAEAIRQFLVATYGFPMCR
ncbi:unnamed protein product [Pedinophyceae sp. YPF-701]|nr:unnamed protein product [Pedinophyceae sp. YPF-701]